MNLHGNKATFTGAALGLITTYIASASPIPLYGIFQTVDGLSYTDLSLSSVVYFVGAVFCFGILGRQSNKHGRKTVAVF